MVRLPAESYIYTPTSFPSDHRLLTGGLHNDSSLILAFRHVCILPPLIKTDASHHQ